LGVFRSTGLLALAAITDVRKKEGFTTIFGSLVTIAETRPAVLDKATALAASCLGIGKVAGVVALTAMIVVLGGPNLTAIVLLLIAGEPFFHTGNKLTQAICASGDGMGKNTRLFAVSAMRKRTADIGLTAVGY
jgi:hypothetical protein